jgi:hypothetical protein
MSEGEDKDSGLGERTKMVFVAEMVLRIKVKIW